MRQGHSPTSSNTDWRQDTVSHRLNYLDRLATSSQLSLLVFVSCCFPSVQRCGLSLILSTLCSTSYQGELTQCWSV